MANSSNGQEASVGSPFTLGLLGLLTYAHNLHGCSSAGYLVFFLFDIAVDFYLNNRFAIFFVNSLLHNIGFYGFEDVFFSLRYCLANNFALGFS